MHQGNSCYARGLRPGILCIVLSAAILPGSAAAQDARPRRSPDPATPSPAHERMKLFEGTWVPEPAEDGKRGAKPSSASQEVCAWLSGGRRHLVCRTTYTVEGYSVPRESMYVLSYREADSIYIAHFAFPSGDNLVYHGRLEGDRWVMDLQPTPLLPANKRLREIITVVPEGLRYVEEQSVDGGPWTVTEDYRRRRIR